MHSLLLQKIHDLYALLSTLVGNFPKKDRYTLGVRMEIQSLCLLEEVVRAEQTPPVLKDRALIEADVKNAVLRLLIRIAKEKNCIGATNYFTLGQMTIEIGKMIGGWRKSVRD